MSIEVPIKKNHENNKDVNKTDTYYAISVIDHTVLNENQYFHFSGKQYEYKNICRIAYLTKDEKDCIVKFNEIVEKEKKNIGDVKLDILQKSPRVVEIYNKNPTWFGKNNFLVSTINILEFQSN